MKAKRFFSVLVAIMLVMSCFAISASAETPAAIKETNHDVTLTIKLVQLKDGDADASNANTHAINGADSDLDTGYTAIQGSTFKIELVDANQNVVTGDGAVSATAATNAAGEVTFATYGENDPADKIPQGRYKVTNTSKPAIQSALVADFYVDLPMTNVAGTGWEYYPIVYPKVPISTGNPTVTKTVKGSNSTGDFGAKANIDAYNGEKAKWHIEATLPVDITNYSKYEINDTIDTTKLGFPANADAVTAKMYKATGDTTGTTANLTKTVTSPSIKVAVSNFSSLNAYAGGKIVVEFETTVEAMAQRIPNDVEVTYNNQPTYDEDKNVTIDNNGGTPDDEPNPDPHTTDPNTPEDPSDDEHEDPDPYVWTGVIELEKQFENITDVTPDFTKVKFDLYKTDTTGTPIATDLGLNNEHKVKVEGLLNGTYYLVEKATDSHYELYGSPIKFVIDEQNLKPTISDGVSSVCEDHYLKNKPQTKLPLTGGTGVVLFAVLGLALAALGVSLFKSKRYE